MPNAEDMERHEDPDLAAAYAAENEAVRLDAATLAPALMVGIIPLGIVLFMLSAALGEWVWKVFPVVFVGLIVGTVFLRSGLIRRYHSRLPIHLPGHGTFTGEAKKRLLRKAMAVLALLALYEVARQAGMFTVLREWLMVWTIPL